MDRNREKKSAKMHLQLSQSSNISRGPNFALGIFQTIVKGVASTKYKCKDSVFYFGIEAHATGCVSGSLWRDRVAIVAGQFCPDANCDSNKHKAPDRID